MMQTEEIKKIVEGNLPESQVDVSDMTGTMDHFQVTVISPAFEGKSLIERHQMVQTPLRPAVEDGRIHALSLKTFTPAQWQKRLR